MGDLAMVGDQQWREKQRRSALLMAELDRINEWAVNAKGYPFTEERDR